MNVDDSRDQISPMDALITGSAIADERCNTLYTTDDTLLMDLQAIDEIDLYREQRGMTKFHVASIFDVLKI